MSFSSRLNYNEIDIYLGLSIYLIINILIYLLNINFIKNKKSQKIILFGIFIRSSFIYIDNFIKIISFSGSDGIAFHFAAIARINNINRLFVNFPFVKSFVFPVYKVLRVELPIVVQSFNLFLFWITNYILYNFMKKNKHSYKILFLYNFSLVTCLLNISLLREMLIVFLLTISLVNLYKWIKLKTRTNLLIFIICTIMAAYQHTGVIFLLLTPLIYKGYQLKKIKKILFLIFTIAIIILIVPQVMNIGYLHKGIDLENQIYNQNKSIGVGSSYITEINSFGQMIRSFPIRYLYFLFSPLPHQIRGGIDMLTALFNSSIYIYINIKIIKYIYVNKRKKNKNYLINSLIISYMICNFIYSLGTTTVGTALRHRDKFIVMLLLILYLIEESERKARLNEKYFNYKKRKSIFTRSRCI